MMAPRKKQKTRIEDIRRVELIEAAHRIFLREGLKGLTTTKICHEAGMSQGILTYYFKDKEQVLFEMVRVANRVLMEQVVSNLRRATTRWQRLLAIIDGNFPANRYDRSTANAWISLVAETAHNARYARLQRPFYSRLRSNIASALAPSLSRDEIDHFVRGFAAMIDGLWLRRGHSETDMWLEEAKLLLTEYTEKMLGDKLVETLKQDDALFLIST
ncbi:transcriptional repressor BetI [Pararhizobium capsulatum DSM 1112]|uniref:Transcriptional repressor BetI n=1 Tax=Pararhizobium capsulatum DSM 1112 TaxID=1121113 RepID=A0ABU0BYD7_9HYPH|nr:transcriptional regulator BetI [Pararhizobium capsulatum]MDQ0323260.1 transcriptional repressor BetI [Pararhizobium capsulatum DSM 1112]